MSKRLFFVLRVLLFIPLSMSVQAAPPAPESTALNKIIFGSCIHQDHLQPIWQAINASEPDLFVFLGDNIYGDTRDMQVLAQKYARLGANPGFQQLKANTPIVAIWDDHDYGENDAGSDYPFKEESRRIMLDFFEEPADSVRRSRDSGIYAAYYFGEGEQRVQLLLTDLRWNRSPPKEQTWYEYLWSLINSRGPYLATEDDGATLLGDKQWQWLEQELAKPAAIRIFASSLQIIPESSGWEAWAVFPKERERLFRLLENSRQQALLLISGDTHWSEFSQLQWNEITLLELTSSGLTEEWQLVSPNEHRLGAYYNKANFGMIDIDWQAKQIHAGIYDEQGKQRLVESMPFSPDRL